ncbi:MAG: isocitrate/isopropylmalate dehydrogenase family protein [Gammaproteobacteria bacterium]|nr:isocitrate/isopropylmalate dehydrogenase family protein [Gammaproteobacteria bacterium]
MKVLILPGDGIGPEITEVVNRALHVLNDDHKLGLNLVERSMGLATLRSEGTTMPQALLDEIHAADGVVLAPAHTYAYPAPEQGGINPSAALRRGLDLYANIRPAKKLPGVPCMARAIDLVVVRENTEGFYADRSMFAGSGEFMPTEDVALSVRKITRKGCMRIARTAFELAMQRRKQVTMVHKANVLKMTDGLFVECCQTVAKDFPEVELSESIIDAMTARLIRNPDIFDVIVTTNMYGDILSDEATELSGGLGLGGALNAGEVHGMAQATHGSAPDIEGRNIANPTALLLSCVMMLSWMAGKHGRDDLGRASQLLRDGIETTLSDARNHTPDLGGSGTTRGFGDALVSVLRNA